MNPTPLRIAILLEGTSTTSALLSAEVVWSIRVTLSPICKRWTSGHIILVLPLPISSTVSTLKILGTL